MRVLAAVLVWTECLFLLPAEGAAEDKVTEVRGEILEKAVLTVVYDNVVYDSNYASAHGFACAVRVSGPEGSRALLFDTGGDFQTLSYNLRFSGWEISEFEALVISHCHYDHTGGLEGVVQQNPRLPVYLPGTGMHGHTAAGHSLENAHESGRDPERIFPGVWSTGVLQGSVDEQSLVILTEKGVVLITGCAHPGIVRIVKTVQERFGREIYLVMGGFHRPPRSAAVELRRLGVQHAAPSHCTGAAATSALREAFGDGFIKSGVGRTVTVE